MIRRLKKIFAFEWLLAGWGWYGAYYVKLRTPAVFVEDFLYLPLPPVMGQWSARRNVKLRRPDT